MQRRVDLDWIRILAFGSLILYHVGMYYVSWDYHVKSPFASGAIEPLMVFVNPWRLALLFLVSGAATAFLAAKMAPAGVRASVAGAHRAGARARALGMGRVVVAMAAPCRHSHRPGRVVSLDPRLRRRLAQPRALLHGVRDRLLRRALYALDQWAAIVAACGFGRRLFKRDGPARLYLTDAVFPFYIVHQTALIAFAVWLRPMKLRPLIEGPQLILLVALACIATYEAVKRVAWLRPLFGLKPASRGDGELGMQAAARGE